MQSVTVTGHVRVPVERVFDFLVDNRHDPLWCPLASDVELVEGEPGTGALYRFEQWQGPGRTTRTSWLRTTDAVRPHHLRWDNGGRGLPYEAVVELRPTSTGTRIEHTNRVTLPDRVQQLVWWTGARAVLRLQLRNLRRELER